MKNFYIADTHFGHCNIIKLCQRPFREVDEMNQTIIRNWNRTVNNEDTVYILGDIAFSKNSNNPSEYLNKLKGRKIIIKGNHDYDVSKNKRKYLKLKIVDGIYDYLEIKDNLNGELKKIILSHYPILEWNGFFKGTLHLYGHIHNNVENRTFKIMQDINNAYNVGADILDFTPRTLDEVIEYNKKFALSHQ